MEKKRLLLLGRLMSRPPKSGVRKPQPTGQTWPALEDKVVLGNARCCNENTTAGWLKRHSSLPGSWGLEVRGRGAGLAGSWRGLSPCLQAATAPLRPSRWREGERVGPLPALVRRLVPSWGSILMTESPPKGPHLSTLPHWGLRVCVWAGGAGGHSKSFLGTVAST